MNPVLIYGPMAYIVGAYVAYYALEHLSEIALDNAYLLLRIANVRAMNE